MFALLGLICSVSLVQAQTSAKADKIISSSQASFEGFKDLKATFTYTLNNPNLKKPIVKKGELTLKGESYKIAFADEKIVCDGKYIYILLEEDEEVTVSDYTEESMGPKKIFSVYEDNTKSRYDGEEAGNHKITLFSETKESDIWKTELWIGKKDKNIAKAIMHARNGSNYQYEMDAITPNTGVADAAFSVDTNGYEDDGWIVNDLTE